MTAISRAQLAPARSSALSRIYGFGSVFAKTIRDSRRATILMGVVLGLALLGVGKAITSQFATPASRQEIANIVQSVPPILQGFAGKPVNVATLGGYLQYKYGTFFPIIASIWSILALSGTLAAEARRGSLEFVTAAPISRRRIALEKLMGHIVVVAIASALIFASLATVGSAFPVLPGDEIPIGAAAGYAIWLGLLGLIAGALAFALAQFLGRGAAIGIAGAVTFAGFIVNGYQAALPDLAPIANLTWFGWTTNHIPLAGLYDWPSVALVAVVTVVLFAIGVEAFVRRDIGATSAVPSPGLPASLIGTNGAIGRAVGELLPNALAWGLGLGIFGLLIAGSGKSFADAIQKSPDFVRLLSQIFPRIELSGAGGFLQLMFIEFGLVLAGLAAATLVANWTSDESSGRLEMVLASPLARTRWVISGGLGVLIGIALVVAMAAIGIGIGASITGGDIATPVAGTLVLGLYAIALAGIGIAIGGLVSTSAAAPAVAILTVLIWLIDIIAPPLGLPDAIAQLALTTHYGQPMLGVWDPAGILASVVLAVIGVAIGAWGFVRRDLRG